MTDRKAPPAPPAARDDSLMSRFDQLGLRRFRARDALIAVGVVALLLVLFEGASVRRAGDEMNPGPGRTLVLAVGRPAGWLADELPLAKLGHRLTAWLSPDTSLAGAGPGFAAALSSGSAGGGVPPVTPDAFDPTALGEPSAPKRALHTLLVTGDSMSMPLDQDLARRLAGAGVRVIRDPHVGTGISKTILLDWGKLATSQVRRDRPDAVVVFIGANEGFPMAGPGGRSVNCCGPLWAAIYASRARMMMNTYRRGGAARVYWLTVPTPRDPARQRIARVVNAAVGVAAEPWRDQVRLIDTVPVFTPGERYRDSMPLNGSQTIVRESDGIHLNAAGSNYAASIVLGQVGRDFTW